MLPEAPKLMKRAKRAAKAVMHGTAIFNDMQAEPARSLLIEGAEEGVPSVGKVADLLHAKYNDHIKQTPVKTLVGLCARAILAEEGYELVERGVRVPADMSVVRVFSTGAVYAKADVSDDEDESDDELVRLLVAVGERLLSEQDRKRVVEELKATYS